MTRDDLDRVLAEHAKWLRGEGDARANLHDANLHGACLTGAYLRDANLHGANLHDADLRGANLHRAYLRDADLHSAYLHGADLHDANLHGACLNGADLRYSNLNGAYLRYSNLNGACLTDASLHLANLRGANLTGARLPSPTMMLLAWWGELSDSLTALAMAYDASCHPDPSAFSVWANGGPCPYDEVKVYRACNFRERKECWDPDLPAPRPYDLMVELIREKCSDSDFHDQEEK